MSNITGDISTIGENAANVWGPIYNDHLDGMLAIEEKRCGFQEKLALAIGTFGYINQYLLNQKMVDLAERGVDLAEDQYDLAVRNYEEVVLNAYTKSANYFMDCIPEMKDHMRDFIECGLGPDNDLQEVDYDLEEGRACAAVNPVFDKAHENVNRRFGKFRTGAIKDARLRIELGRATAKTDAVNKAYRYAEARQDRYNDRQWQRKQAAAQIAYNISTMSMNGLHQGVSGSVSGVNSTNNSLGNVLDAQQGASSAFLNLGNFWGSVANGAFQFAGYGSYQSLFTNGGGSQGAGPLAGGGFSGTTGSQLQGGGGYAFDFNSAADSFRSGFTGGVDYGGGFYGDYNF